MGGRATGRADTLPMGGGRVNGRVNGSLSPNGGENRKTLQNAMQNATTCSKMQHRLLGGTTKNAYACR